MKLQLVVLFGLALAAQLVNAAWHGFDPVEDGLQIISAGTLALLVLRLSRARSERRKALILRVLDEFGQPLTVFQGYVSMLADGTLTSLNGHTKVLQRECERMRSTTRKLVDAIRDYG
jgi:signal transduction histidine kinase